MKHTVVIPLYNKEAYIYDTIRSLAFQEKKPSEIIVVDDCSTDLSLVCLKEALSFFAPQFLKTNIQIIALDENLGSGNARNVGIEHATGELISFLDADASYTPSSLREIGELMEDNTIDFLVFGILVMPSNYYLPNIKSFKNELTFLSNGLFLIPNALRTISSSDFSRGFGSNVVIRKKYLKKVRYETNVSLYQDIVFWYQVLKNIGKDARIALLNKACVEVQEVEERLPKMSFATWKEVQVPITIKRYNKSSDQYDKQLMGVLSQKWFRYAMKHLPSWRQKTLFVLSHSAILIKNYFYFKKRNN
ncbi:glycosyltransferase family 2 protein [Flavobacterium hercynium]|uniref:Glycosyltransferase 2-like domain-containing protein n=1 Tax=Flavobacterium hercynium TaxID=387094 RepID=A0A226HCU3_9FLAO|nr:glycosyltransferase family 2 protein [Flavobacterium hercynium]OXA92103.1 hypothetical protein B0A66_10055 [Flavobacterium hercynium]SMP24980.1 Glycosyl transferase family 2 [Flavobacterium hercynium]